MAWITEDRRTPIAEKHAVYLTDELKALLAQKYFPRYPTRRAVLLPAFHLVQHTYNWIPTQAVQEVAEFLEVAPAEALDTASFYEEFWLKPKGKYLVGVCRSIACELCDKQVIIDHIKAKLDLEVGQTSEDGKFTLIEMECLGACGTAPVALVNDVLHENLTVEKINSILEGLPADPHDFHDPTITWSRGEH